VSPTRRIVVAWARVQAYAGGSASADVVPIRVGASGDTLVVVQCIMAGRVRCATLRLPSGPIDLHLVAEWAEHLEERASRVVLSQLMPTVHRDPEMVLH
jgi:hypothetical protein